MPTRTISVAGGNWNATGTWVGAVVPVAGDDIVGLSTSGNLTINVSTADMQSCDFSNYLGTITINQRFNIGHTTPGTSTFSATMSFATTAGYSDTNTINLRNSGTTGTHSILTNGLKFPIVRIENQTGKQVRLLDDFNITTLVLPQGNTRSTLVGTYSIRTQNILRSNTGGGNIGQITSTQSTLYIVGPTASFRNESFTDPCCFGDINVVVDTSINGDGGAGTVSTTNIIGFSGHTGTNEFTWASGTMIGDKRLQIFSHVVDSVINLNNSVRLDVANAGTWSEVFYQEYTTSNSPNTKKILRLDSDLKFDMMSSQPAWISPVSNSSLRRPFSVIGGPGALKGGRFMALTFQGMHNSNTPFGQSGYATYSTPIIELASGMTHSFSDLHIFGYEGPLQLRNSNLQAAGLAWIKSFTNSVPATINYTGTQGQVAFYTYFQDINASSANTIYVYSGGQSGSTNISAIDFGGGATTSGGTKAFTYIN